MKNFRIHLANLCRHVRDRWNRSAIYRFILCLSAQFVVVGLVWLALGGYTHAAGYCLTALVLFLWTM